MTITEEQLTQAVMMVPRALFQGDGAIQRVNREVVAEQILENLAALLAIKPGEAGSTDD